MKQFYPKEIEIETTQGCNMDPPCVICSRNTVKSLNQQFISEKVIDELNPLFQNAKSCLLHGLGEPLIRKELFSLIAKFPIKTNCCFNSNGVLLTGETIKNLLDRRLGIINVSLDAASTDTYRKIRRHDYFDQIKTNLKSLAQLKKERNVEFPKVIINMTLMKENLPEVVDFVSTAEEVEADSVSFGLLSKISGNYMVQSYGFQFDYIAQMLDPQSVSFIEKIAAAKEECDRANIEFIQYDVDISNVLGISIAKEMQHNRKYFCSFPWERIGVEINGKVRVCCESDFILGNIFNASLSSLLNSERLFEFRHLIAEGTLPSECRRCRRTLPRPALEPPYSAKFRCIEKSFDNISKRKIGYKLCINNTGNYEWPKKYAPEKRILLGCRIYPDEPRKTQWDKWLSFPIELRKELPRDIKPGEDFSLLFEIDVKKLLKGRYEIRFDMVFELSFWFEDFGSIPLVDFINVD